MPDRSDAGGWSVTRRLRRRSKRLAGAKPERVSGVASGPSGMPIRQSDSLRDQSPLVRPGQSQPRQRHGQRRADQRHKDHGRENPGRTDLRVQENGSERLMAFPCDRRRVTQGRQNNAKFRIVHRFQPCWDDWPRRSRSRVEPGRPIAGSVSGQAIEVFVRETGLGRGHNRTRGVAVKKRGRLEACLSND